MYKHTTNTLYHSVHCPCVSAKCLYASQSINIQSCARALISPCFNQNNYKLGIWWSCVNKRMEETCSSATVGIVECSLRLEPDKPVQVLARGLLRAAALGQHLHHPHKGHLPTSPHLHRSCMMLTGALSKEVLSEARSQVELTPFHWKWNSKSKLIKLINVEDTFKELESSAIAMSQGHVPVLKAAKAVSVA